MVVQKHLEALEGLRNKVSENATDESEIRIKMADILLTKKRKGDAEPHFDWIFENAPKSRAAGAAHLMLVRLAIRAGDMEGAKEHAQAVLGTETDLQFRIEARSKLAELAFADDDIAEVVRQYEAIIEADPDSRAAERARNQLPDLRAELE
jgi:predicted negative regulator of RcsB-dependent stress response